MNSPAVNNSSQQQIINWLVTVGSVLLCLLLLPLRLPGMELAGIGPNWLLVWVVAWSLKRSVWQAALAGFAIGLAQDGMTAFEPTHTLSLMIVGMMTARLQTQRYIQEDFISVALIVFGMAVLGETVMAVQYSWQSLHAAKSIAWQTVADVWLHHQRVSLASAILSSLWAPALYYPLNRWWARLNLPEAS